MIHWVPGPAYPPSGPGRGKIIFISIITAETQVFIWEVSNSPQLVGSPWGRVTLFTKESDLGGWDSFYPCKPFVLANRDNFSDERMRNKTFN